MNELERCEYYLRTWLPARLTEGEAALLEAIGVPVAFELHHASEQTRIVVQQRSEGLVIQEHVTPVCTYRMATSTLLQIVSGRWSPQRALFTGKLRISGDKLLAVRLGSLLESVFRRIPWDGRIAPHTAPVHSAARELSDRQRKILALHFDPGEGARYWVERSRVLGIAATDLRTLDDLAAFGGMDREAMARRPWRDFVPARVLRESMLTLGETGGTTGAPITSAWTAEDFEAGFVRALVRELEELGEPSFSQWLFIGPTGPHIIGKAADALARHTSGVDAMKVDFDPRWHRSLLPGTTAAIRHRAHLLRQTLALLNREAIDVLFITPSILRILLEKHCGTWIAKLRLVHLGGQSVSPEERAWLVSQLPDRCLLIDGYGNSLFGCLIEDRQQPLRFRADGDRLVIRLLRDPEELRAEAMPGGVGRIMFHRFDESMLILNAVERDEADVTTDGFEWPRPASEWAEVTAGGIY